MCVTGVCVVVMRSPAEVPQPSVPWDTASLTHRLDSGKHFQQMWSEAIFIQGVFKDFYVLVTSCFSFLLCFSLKYLVKEDKRKPRKQIPIFGYTQKHFFK